MEKLNYRIHAKFILLNLYYIFIYFYNPSTALELNLLFITIESIASDIYIRKVSK